MRSSAMAMTTMASPASTPPPMSRRRSAVSTSKPRPPAPIIEAMITMLSESMMTWFTPTISDGMAVGTCTFQSIWRGRQPDMRPASMISVGTAVNASVVTRTIGGMA